MRQPHDTLVRGVIGDPRHARGVLEGMLPPAIVARLDFETLKRESGELVSAEGQRWQTDLLFSVQSVDHDPILIYLLFEHQSTEAPRMMLRLLNYMIQVWLRWDEAHPGQGPLPPVLPLLLTHTDGGWRQSTEFHDLFSAKVRAESLSRNHSASRSTTRSARLVVMHFRDIFGYL